MSRDGDCSLRDKPTFASSSLLPSGVDITRARGAWHRWRLVDGQTIAFETTLGDHVMEGINSTSITSPTTNEQPIYKGRREPGGRCVVTRAGRPLEPRLDLWNHSPDGFEWGYWGSGPAQLALAILADHLGDDERAVRLHQDFKRVVVAMLPRESWALTTSQVAQAVAAIEASYGAGVT